MSVYIKSVCLNKDKIRFKIHIHLNSTGETVTNVFNKKKNCSFDRNFTYIYSKKGTIYEIKENEIKLVDNLYYLIQSLNVIEHTETPNIISNSISSIISNNISTERIISNNIFTEEILSQQIQNNDILSHQNIQSNRTDKNEKLLITLLKLQNKFDENELKENNEILRLQREFNEEYELQERRDILRLQKKFDEEDELNKLIILQKNIETISNMSKTSLKTAMEFGKQAYSEKFYCNRSRPFGQE